MPSIQLGTRQIEYFVTSGKSRRYTYFRFRHDMRLEIVIPSGRRVDIDSAIKGRRSWILKQYDEVLHSNRVLDSETVLFDGTRLKIVFEKDNEKEELQPDLARKVVIVRSSDSSRIRELVRRWFLRETSRYVMQKLSDLSSELSLEYRQADVREIKNWGYCTKDCRLSFSWQLIALPERLREYIIFHELAHLSELNHSPAFRKRLGVICPDYKQREKELDGIVPL